MVLAAAETGVQGTDFGPQATPLGQDAALSAGTAHDLAARPDDRATRRMTRKSAIAGRRWRCRRAGPGNRPPGRRRQPHRASSDSRGRPDHRRRNAAFDHEYWQVQRRAHEFPGGQPLYTYTIDWGDGTPFNSGTATIDSFGQGGSPIKIVNEAPFVYADNGIYAASLTIASQLGESSDALMVTVDNVETTLDKVVPDQTIDEGSVLAITDIGAFTDPGFDNPLNEGGETSERFTFAVDWGDGTEVDSGLATIDVHRCAGSAH